MDNIIENAINDKEYINSKIIELNEFLNSDEFNSLSPEDKADMLSQKYHMECYLNTLVVRIERHL